MQLRAQKRFEKELQKLTPKMQKKTKAVITQFQSNPHHPGLRNHALRGTLHGQRAISVAGDIRIIFKENNNYQYVTLLRIGTHNQVY